MRIGYARVSTRDQNFEMQLGALNQAGCKRIFTDKLSGAQVERPGLKEALSHLREADTLVVWKLDRLGRSVKGLVDLVNELEAQKDRTRFEIVQWKRVNRLHSSRPMFLYTFLIFCIHFS